MADSADIEQLRAEARHHRQRLELYEARSYGPRPTSAVRLREYRRAAEAAEARLRFAEEQARAAGEDPPRAP
ncbi:hypothetical protein [Baekduia soli]|uniref:hypothetical protein n=1 Tax=Baekduia soli TaxID=496014 RepID=UPI0016528A5B|nr:hypothetical protein [Baekduia soli]